jgi:hypothetical protein
VFVCSPLLALGQLRFLDRGDDRPVLPDRAPLEPPRGVRSNSTSRIKRTFRQGLPLSSVRMPRFHLPAAGDAPSVTGALALAVAVLALVAAGCSNSGGHPAAIATAGAPRSSAPCKLDRVQHRAVARALADIRRLRRIQAPIQTFSQHGAPTQNAVTGKLMLDLGSANLPLNVYAHLLHLGKAAVSLCVIAPWGSRGRSRSWGTGGEALWITAAPDRPRVEPFAKTPRH